MSESVPGTTNQRGLRALLKIEPGEAWSTGLLAGYLALGIASVIALKAASDSLFLSRFEASQLPYADLAVTALVGVVVGLYLKLSNRLPLARLVQFTQVLMAGLFALLWYGLAAGWAPAAIVLYVWVGIYAVLVPSQVWSIANSVLTTRQAKRLFSLIGSGGIAGAAMGGRIANFAGTRNATEAVLLAAAAILLLGAAIAAVLSRRMLATNERRAAAKERASLLASFRLVMSQRYLRLITASLFLSAIVSTLVKFQFKAVAKASFAGDQAALTTFFGDFYGYIAVFSFVFHVLFTSRLLRLFGLGAGLFVLPLALGLGGVALLTSAGLWAAVVARGADQSFRHSLDRASNELLYMPLAARVRTQVKSFLDIVVSRFADGIASLLLLLLLEVLTLASSGVSWAVVLGVIPWVATVWLLRREYVDTLRASIERPELNPEEILKRISASEGAARIAETLEGSDHAAQETAIDWMRLNQAAPEELHLRALLKGTSPAVRQKAFEVIVEQRLPGYFKQAAEHLEDDIAVEERWKLLGYLEAEDGAEAEQLMQALLVGPNRELAATAGVRLLHHGGAIAEEAMTHLKAAMSDAAEPTAEWRALRARLIGFLPDSPERLEYLGQALTDEEPEVLREAIESAAALRAVEASERLIELLGNPAVRREARTALEAIGAPAVAAVAGALGRVPPSEQAGNDLLRVLGTIGDGDATVALLNALDAPTFAMRRMAGRCLARVVERAPSRIDRTRVEQGLRREIQASYQERVLLSAVQDRAETPRIVFLQTALRERSSQRTKRVFWHLALLYPWREMRDAAYWIDSGDDASRSNALEFLETRLANEHRRLVLPLLEPNGDGVLPDAAREEFGLIPLPYENAVRRLLTRPDPWLQACGAYAAPESGVDGIGELLKGLRENPDALVRETAIAAAERMRA